MHRSNTLQQVQLHVINRPNMKQESKYTYMYSVTAGFKSLSQGNVCRVRNMKLFSRNVLVQSLASFIPSALKSNDSSNM